MRGFQIGDRWIGDGSATYIIAEIGSNHDQSLDQAAELIGRAAEAGADAAKFQSLNFSRQYAESAARDEDRTLFRSIELCEDWYPKLKKICDEQHIDFLSAPTYVEAVDLLEAVDVVAYKVASPQFDLFPEITNRVLATHKPVIFSAGFSTIGQIDATLRRCRSQGFEDFVLLHCVSQYPTPAEAVNLLLMQTLRSTFDCLVGFSDHTQGTHFAIAAVALGACVIEKHFTLDRSLSGPDHHFAIEPDELGAMIQQIRELRPGLGTGRPLDPDVAIEGMRARIAMKLVAARTIKAGSRITRDAIILRRGEGGIVRSEMDLVLKCTLRTDREVETGQLLSWSDLEHRDD